MSFHLYCEIGTQSSNTDDFVLCRLENCVLAFALMLNWLCQCVKALLLKPFEPLQSVLCVGDYTFQTPHVFIQTLHSSPRLKGKFDSWISSPQLPPDKELKTMVLESNRGLRCMAMFSRS